MATGPNIEGRSAVKAPASRPISIDEARSLTPGALSHDALALQMGEAWRSDARYVAAWGRWLFWNGAIWRFDDTLQHMTRTRAFLREKAQHLPTAFDDFKRHMRRADTIAKVVGLARSNPVQAATVEQWDADPWLLGTPSGTVDLRTGELREARPEDYITKTTAVAPAPPGTAAPMWSSHIKRITGGDAELAAYLQRLFGYTLTGSTREHVLPFAYGGGANGKSVTVNTELGVMGDYGVVIPTEMLMVSQGDRHPTEVARLRGVRLAVGSETEQGRRWAEARIKALTGGDPIAARFMRQDFFEFEPQFKLFVIGNHRPSLRGVDEAMRRRLHLVPFTVTIPERERDKDLPEKLRAEWPAILRWAIDGCLSWQREGLKPPERVRDATEAYLEAEDSLILWIEECCTPDGDAWEPSGTLFKSWKQWAERAEEFVGSRKRFATVLEERGFVPKRQGGTGIRGYVGLRLNPVDDTRGWRP